MFRKPILPLRRLAKASSNLAQSSRKIQNELVFPGSVRSQITNELEFLDPSLKEPMKTFRFVNLDGTVGTSIKTQLAKEKALKMYKDMVTVSIMDNILYEAQRQGRFSFYMVSAGEEGAAVGSSAALLPQDLMFCQYREQGAILHRGVTLKEIMSQMYANKNDQGGGRSMPVHYQSKAHNIHPISSPLATQIPHAVGAAYSMKLAQQNQNPDKRACTIVYFGEGAASEGDFHAALNIAATRGCPIIFFCRNNGYAISTPSIEQYKGDGIASRGVGYGIDTIRVDGNDILAVYEVTKRAREMALSNQKPVIIESMSYRIAHHSTSDDSFAYRSKDEVSNWQRRDNPIVRFRKWLALQNWWTDEQDADLHKAQKKLILKEFSDAEKEKKPPISNLFNDTFDSPTEILKEQQRELKEILKKYPSHFDVSPFDKGSDGL